MASINKTYILVIQHYPVCWISQNYLRFEIPSFPGDGLVFLLTWLDLFRIHIVEHFLWNENFCAEYKKLICLKCLHFKYLFHHKLLKFFLYFNFTGWNLRSFLNWTLGGWHMALERKYELLRSFQDKSTNICYYYYYR